MPLATVLISKKSIRCPAMGNKSCWIPLRLKGMFWIMPALWDQVKSSMRIFWSLNFCYTWDSSQCAPLRFYQKITDIYSQCRLTILLIAKSRKISLRQCIIRFNYPDHGNTAAEVCCSTGRHHKTNIWDWTSWRNAPDGKIVKSDVYDPAKNYLTKKKYRI